MDKALRWGSLAPALLGLFAVIDFVEGHSPGFLAFLATLLGFLLALAGLTRAALGTGGQRRVRELIALSSFGLVLGSIGLTALVLTELLGFTPAPVAYSSEGVTLDRHADLPRCNAEVSGRAPAGDGHVWVAHSQANTGEYFFTPAERDNADSRDWVATLTLGADPGVAVGSGPEYEMVAFVASEEGDAFLRERAIAIVAAEPEDGAAEPRVVAADPGLVYFRALPPGVTAANAVTVERQAGPSGKCGSP